MVTENTLSKAWLSAYQKVTTDRRGDSSHRTPQEKMVGKSADRGEKDMVLETERGEKGWENRGGAFLG